MNDILVHGSNQQEHDKRLLATLEWLQPCHITLNKDKCEFLKTSVNLGHIINHNRIKPDPEKIQAICEINEPNSLSDIRRFLGMCNQLSKFSPELTEATKPLHDLLCSKNQWVWDQPQQTAFQKTESILSVSPVLTLYDMSLPTKVSTDASSYGLGAALLQKQINGGWKPVAYSSRAMTNTEQKYAQIEREALAVTWACERFNHYLLGMCFEIKTDHKPLVSLLGKKPIDELPLRIQHFKMRLMNTSAVFPMFLASV